MADDPENESSENEDNASNEDASEENSGEKDDSGVGDDAGGGDPGDEGEGESGEEESSGDEEEGELNPEDVEIETRTKVKKAKVSKKEDDEDVDVDDQAAISKIVKKETEGIRESNQVLKDTVEVDTFIRRNSQFSKYRGIMLKYMGNDSYKNIPVKNIAAMVSSGDQQKLGAEKERTAAERAGKTRDAGESARKPGGGKVDWATAPKEAFDKKMAEIKGYPV